MFGRVFGEPGLCGSGADVGVHGDVGLEGDVFSDFRGIKVKCSMSMSYVEVKRYSKIRSIHFC